MPPLFGQEVGTGQVVGITALVSTILTGVLALIGTYLSNRHAARLKADDRDNDDKWKIIGELKEENVEIKKEFADYRDETQKRYDDLAREHTACMQTQARFEERVGFLEDWMEAQGIRIPRKRPQPGSDLHRSLPPAAEEEP